MIANLTASLFALALGAFLAVPVAGDEPDCRCPAESSYVDSGNFVGLDVDLTDHDGRCVYAKADPPRCSVVGYYNCRLEAKVAFDRPSGVTHARVSGQRGWTRIDPDGTRTWIGVGSEPCRRQGRAGWPRVDLIVVCGGMQDRTIFFYNNEDDCGAAKGTEATGAVGWVKVFLRCGGCGEEPREQQQPGGAGGANG